MRIEQHHISRYVNQVLPPQEHCKRKQSIANAVLGLVETAELSITAMGTGFARALARSDKHGIKQVDRLLSNPKFKLERFWGPWVTRNLQGLSDIVVALDWTDYDKDGHSTLSLGLATHKGRAQPLMWKTVPKSQLKGRRNHFEDVLLTQLSQHIPEGVKVTITADRGFADQAFFSFMQSLGFDYVVRIKSSTFIYQEPNTGRPAARWLKASGRTFSLKDAFVTRDCTPIAMFVSCKSKAMKDAWFLVSSRRNLAASDIVKLYGRRFTIEEMFRDDKDPHFGMGLSQTRIRSIHRRDRILFIAAIARAILTTLGAAGESLGYDRLLKANTVKKRTMSLYRQGSRLYLKMKNWDYKRKRPLLRQFEKFLADDPKLSQIIGSFAI